MKKEILKLCFDPVDGGLADELSDGLKALGYGVEKNQRIGEKDFVLLLLSVNTTIEGLTKTNPWVKEQFNDSSFRGFRMMPILPYHGKAEDPDELWDEGIGDLYEELISGEFKPFGFDLDDQESQKEFHRVYEEYSE